jgi:hypothetical protein
LRAFADACAEGEVAPKADVSFIDVEPPELP